jgi:hypothetical protein
MKYTGRRDNDFGVYTNLEHADVRGSGRKVMSTCLSAGGPQLLTPDPALMYPF